MLYIVNDLALGSPREGWLPEEYIPIEGDFLILMDGERLEEGGDMLPVEINGVLKCYLLPYHGQHVVFRTNSHRTTITDGVVTWVPVEPSEFIPDGNGFFTGRFLNQKQRGDWDRPGLPWKYRNE